MFFSPHHSLLTFAIKAYDIKKNDSCQGKVAFAAEKDRKKHFLF
jgi:hypothetical protein